MWKMWVRAVFGVFCAACGLIIGFGPTQAAASNRGMESSLPRYFVIDLGTLGGTEATAKGISDNGWIVGSANLAGDQNGHAFLWRQGRMTDLGTLGGPNSQEQWPLNDDLSLIVGSAETASQDPNNEDFCGFDANSFVPPTGLICSAFAWSAGTMNALPTLGGNNSQAWGVNNNGQVVGMAETSTVDPACAAPQVLDIDATVWRRGQVQTMLQPLSDDAMAWASGINFSGQVIGVSGACMSPNFSLTGTNPQHGVTWQNGTLPTDLGTLGGNVSTFPWAINAGGQVVGFSYLADNSTRHAFLWKNGRIRDLGAVKRPGKPDVNSQAFGLNDRGDVVGGSGFENIPRAFIWHNGVMTDLNTVLARGSAPDYLWWANDINDRGEISLYALNVVKSEFHAALAIPCSEMRGRCEDGIQDLSRIVPAQVLRELTKRLSFARFRAAMPRQ
jgi:probable HAF family extracellular repeat protein